MDSPLRTILDTVLVSSGGAASDGRKFHLQGENGTYCDDHEYKNIQRKPIDSYPPGFFQPVEEEFCQLCLARLKRDVLATYEVYDPHSEGDKYLVKSTTGAGAD